MNDPNVLVIAEIGSVHDGSFGNVLKLIEAAKGSGADAVKFQTHIADAETLPGAPMPSYFTAEGRFEYFKRTAFTLDQWKRIHAYCKTLDVMFLSSPFSEEAVDLLEEVGLTVYKIPSGEVTNTPMLDKIAKLRKPILLSSGMSSWSELDAAVETIRRYHDKLTMLQCTTQYPCEYEQVGLNVMQIMKDRYNLPVGLSDHTPTIYASLAAVTLGAVVIEKHFTFSRKMYGSDAPHSLEPAEFADMVRGIRSIEIMRRSSVDKNDLGLFNKMRETFQKSIVSLVDIPAGATIHKSMLGMKKPGTGISAARLSDVIGKRSARAIAANSVITDADVVWSESGNA